MPNQKKKPQQVTQRVSGDEQPVPVKIVPEKRKPHDNVPRYFMAVSRGVIIWPIAFFGLMFVMMRMMLGARWNQQMDSTIWFCIIAVCGTALCFDFHGSKLLVVALMVAGFIFFLLWVNTSYAFLPGLAKMLKSINIRISSDAMLLGTLVSGTLWMGMMIYAYVQQSWRIEDGFVVNTPRVGPEVEIATVNQPVKVNIRNILIWLIAFGAGHIEIGEEGRSKMIGYVLWSTTVDSRIKRFQKQQVVTTTMDA